eukprot:6184842-Pleurochrysis_carterae.AAC.1
MDRRICTCALFGTAILQALHSHLTIHGPRYTAKCWRLFPCRWWSCRLSGFPRLGLSRKETKRRLRRSSRFLAKFNGLGLSVLQQELGWMWHTEEAFFSKNWAG